MSSMERFRGRNAGMLIGLVVSAVVIVVLVAVIVFLALSPSDDSGDDGKQAPFAPIGQPVTFDEFAQGQLEPMYYQGKWFDDDHLVHRDPASQDLVLFNIKTQATDVLLPLSVMQQHGTFLEVSPKNANLLLLSKGRTDIWRHSYFADYAVYDKDSNQTYPFTIDGEGRVRYAAWLPDSTIVYVLDNDIYHGRKYKHIDPSTDVRITSDGRDPDIFNGVPDWLYEEEVLSTNKALYASSDARYLAFARFDDTKVGTFSYTKYGDPHWPLFNQYPHEIYLKYPKAGTINPTFELKVADLSASSADEAAAVVVKKVTPPPEVEEDLGADYLYSAASWIKADTLSVIWMNRIQSQSITSECTLAGDAWTCVSKSRLSEPTGWVNLFQSPVYNEAGTSFLQVQSVAVDGRHYPHVVRQDNGKVKEKPVVRPLSRGKLAVTTILGWDESAGMVYYLGTDVASPGTRFLYRTKDDGTGEQVCLTCTLRPPSRQPSRVVGCDFNAIDMSPDLTHYIQSCTGSDLPYTELRRVGQEDVLIEMVDNESLRQKLKGRTFATSRFLEVDVGGPGEESTFKAQVRAWLPPGHDLAENKGRRYPLLVNVYAGPESQMVDRQWAAGDWENYLATNYGVVTVHIDGRGSGFQSKEMAFSVYERLGSVEIDDQISVARSLIEMNDADRFPLIDANKTAIWGWSYGGYATLMTLAGDDEDVFKCYLAVAPVTNWLLYDTVYTERYMKTPVENGQQYTNESSVLSKIEKFRGKTMALNHGVADDNVHYQQSMMLVRLLELADIDFEQHSYPEENHGIKSVTPFLYHSFESFLSNCLDFEITHDRPK